MNAIRFYLTTILLWIPLLSCTVTQDEPEGAVPEGWHTLFDGKSLGQWEVTNFGGEGKVSIKDGQILLNRGEDLTGMTWQGSFPAVNYEISLDAMRLQGNDFFCGLTFPVEDSYASLIVAGWAGSIVGISSINGRDASENETTRRMSFQNNRWYRVRLGVTDERIEAWIDEEKVVDVPIENRNFDVRPEMRLSRPLGVAVWRSRAALKNLWYRISPG